MREKLRTLPLSLIFLLALVLRVAAMFVLWAPAYHLRNTQDHFVFGYEEGRVARSLADGDGYSSPMPLPTGPTAFVGPIYPLFLALIFKVFGVYSKASAIVVLLFQCVFASVTCIFIYYCGRDSVGGTAGKLAAVAWAVFPVSLYLTLYRIWDTTLSAMLVAALFWCWLATRDSLSLGRWALAGALLAIVTLMNPTLIVIAIPFLFLSAWRHRQRITVPALVAGMCCAALVSPWLIRNYIQFGTPWLRSNFPLELRVGNNEFSNGQWTESLHPSGPESISLNEHYRDVGEKRFMAEQAELNSRFVPTHRRLFAFATLNRFLYYWTGAWLKPTKEYPNRWPLIALTSGLSLLAFLGVSRMISAGNSAGLLYAGCLFLYPLPYYVTYGQVRFYHSIAPLIILCGAFWVLSLKNAIAEERTSS